MNEKRTKTISILLLALSIVMLLVIMIAAVHDVPASMAAGIGVACGLLVSVPISYILLILFDDNIR